MLAQRYRTVQLNVMWDSYVPSLPPSVQLLSNDVYPTLAVSHLWFKMFNILNDPHQLVRNPYPMALEQCAAKSLTLCVGVLVRVVAALITCPFDSRSPHVKIR